MRILVVEDSWQVGIAITSLLKALGAEVSGPVGTSADAQHLVRKQPAEAALVDFKLRGGELAGGLIVAYMAKQRWTRRRVQGYCQRGWSFQAIA